MLRAEVYARALRASETYKEESVKRAGSTILPSPLKWKLFMELASFVDVSGVDEILNNAIPPTFRRVVRVSPYEWDFALQSEIPS